MTASERYAMVLMIAGLSVVRGCVAVAGRHDDVGLKGK